MGRPPFVQHCSKVTDSLQLARELDELVLPVGKTSISLLTVGKSIAAVVATDGDNTNLTIAQIAQRMFDISNVLVRVMDPARGSEVVIRELTAPAVRDAALAVALVQGTLPLVGAFTMLHCL